MIIEVNNLKKNFKRFSALKGVDLKVSKGEIHGFLGPNGAGKSTTIKVLLGFIEKSEGEVKLFNTLVHKGNTEHRKRIGYLPSDISFPVNMTGEHVINFALEMRGVNPNSRVKELSDLLNVDLSKKMKNYSKGNKQKIGIIQALAHNPELLILDEPTTGLDPLMQDIFNNILIEEKRKGTTILMSSHILNDVESVCDNVTMIKEGEIILTDNIKNVKANKIKKVIIEHKSNEKVDLSNVPGLNNYKAIGNIISFDVQGDINLVLKKIHNLDISDLEIKDLSLDQIFMNYYTANKEEKNVHTYQTTMVK